MLETELSHFLHECRTRRHLSQDELSRRMQKLGEAAQEKALRSRFFAIERTSAGVLDLLTHDKQRASRYFRALDLTPEEIISLATEPRLLPYLQNYVGYSQQGNQAASSCSSSRAT